MVHARKIAIAHLITEAVAIWICLMTWCIIIFFFLAVVPSSVVACCSKQRTLYSIWSCLGVLLFMLHVITIMDAFKGSRNYFYYVDSMVFYLMQIVLCTLNVLVVYIGCKTASALGDQTFPHHSVLEDGHAGGPVGVSMQMPRHLVQGVQLAEVVTQS